MTIHRLLISLVVPLAAMFPVCARDCDPSAASPDHAVNLEQIVREAVTKHIAREKRLEDYAYNVHATRRNFSEPGKPWQSATIQVLFVEGVQYSRLVKVNDLPLPPEQFKNEDQRLESFKKRLRDAAETHPTISYGYARAVSHFALPIQELPEQFNLKLKGVQALYGRKAYVIEALPKTGIAAANSSERNAQNFKLMIWIDQQDYEISRIQGDVVGEGASFPQDLAFVAGAEPPKSAGSIEFVYVPGTILTVEWAKSNQEIWLPKKYSSKMEFWFRANGVLAKTPGPKGFRMEGTATFFDYKKFQVSSRILP